MEMAMRKVVISLIIMACFTGNALAIDYSQASGVIRTTHNGYCSWTIEVTPQNSSTVIASDNGSFTNHYTTYCTGTWTLYPNQMYVDIECCVYDLMGRLIHHSIVEDEFAVPAGPGPGTVVNFSFPSKQDLGDSCIIQADPEPLSLESDSWAGIKTSF